MMTDKIDDVTPYPRLSFRKEGFSGMWYTDIEGRDRCTASWVGPCPFCHRAEGPRTRAQCEAQTDEERVGADAAAAAGARRYGEVEDEAKLAEIEAASVAAHAAAGVEVSEESYQYVSVWDGGGS